MINIIYIILMNPNFYKIEREIHIDELMQKHPYKLFVLIFSVDNNFDTKILNNTFTIKKNIKKNFSEDTNSIYLFINLQKYIIKENKYSKFITKDSIPYISFYFNFNHLARITNTEYDLFESTYHKIYEQLEDHFKLASNNNNDNNNDDNNDNNNDGNNDDDNSNTNISNRESENNNLDELTEQVRQQRKIEEIENLKQQYLINELTKLKKAKEIQEKLENKQ